MVKAFTFLVGSDSLVSTRPDVRGGLWCWTLLVPAVLAVVAPSALAAAASCAAGWPPQGQVEDRTQFWRTLTTQELEVFCTREQELEMQFGTSELVAAPSAALVC